VSGDPDDSRLAEVLATRAGELLVELRRRPLDARALGAAGDREANRLILAELARLRPTDAVLSEEAADDRRRLDAARVWIVDPLDGTREYSEDGRTDWAVHVALWSGGHLAAAAVALPALGRTYSTVAPPPLTPPGHVRRLAVSRTRPPPVATLAAERIGAELLPMGSAGAKAMAVVRGEADAYLHVGGQHEWDSAAPVGVALAVGLHASRANGDPLVYNRQDPWLPDLLICRPELAGALVAVVTGDLQ